MGKDLRSLKKKKKRKIFVNKPKLSLNLESISLGTWVYLTASNPPLNIRLEMRSRGTSAKKFQAPPEMCRLVQC